MQPLPVFHPIGLKIERSRSFYIFTAIVQKKAFGSLQTFLPEQLLKNSRVRLA